MTNTEYADDQYTPYTINYDFTVPAEQIENLVKILIESINKQYKQRCLYVLTIKAFRDRLKEIAIEYPSFAEEINNFLSSTKTQAQFEFELRNPHLFTK